MSAVGLVMGSQNKRPKVRIPHLWKARNKTLFAILVVLIFFVSFTSYSLLKLMYVLHGRNSMVSLFLSDPGPDVKFDMYAQLCPCPTTQQARLCDISFNIIPPCVPSRITLYYSPSNKLLPPLWPQQATDVLVFFNTSPLWAQGINTVKRSD